MRYVSLKPLTATVIILAFVHVIACKALYAVLDNGIKEIPPTLVVPSYCNKSLSTEIDEGKNPSSFLSAMSAAQERIQELEERLTRLETRNRILMGFFFVVGTATILTFVSMTLSHEEMYKFAKQFATMQENIGYLNSSLDILSGQNGNALASAAPVAGAS